MRIAGHPQK